MISFPNAKINLGLYVTEKRADGYHNLESVFYPIDLKDALEIFPAPSFSLDVKGLSVAGNVGDNLVVKAWAMLQKDFPEQVKGVKTTLLKQIPMGAGMGGGSADGSFMLKMLNEQCALGLSSDQLKQYALSLGSDCPFFVENVPALAKGRGEILQAIDINLGANDIHIICPKIHVSTATAFANITCKPANFDLSRLSSLDINDWSAHLENDFEPSVFAVHPELAQIKASFYAKGAIYASMSGTGATIYGIFPKGKARKMDLDIDNDQYIV